MTPRLTRPWRTLVPFLALLACGPAPDTPPELVPLTTASFGGIAEPRTLFVVFEVTHDKTDAVWIRPDVSAGLPAGLSRSPRTREEMIDLTLELYQSEVRSTGYPTQKMLHIHPSIKVARALEVLDWLNAYLHQNELVTWSLPDGRVGTASVTLYAPNSRFPQEISPLAFNSLPVTLIAPSGRVTRCETDPVKALEPKEGVCGVHEAICAPVTDPQQTLSPRVGICVNDDERWQSVFDRLQAAKVTQMTDLVLLVDCADVGFE